MSLLACHSNAATLVEAVTAVVVPHLSNNAVDLLDSCSNHPGGHLVSFSRIQCQDDESDSSVSVKTGVLDQDEKIGLEAQLKLVYSCVPVGS